MCEFVFVFVSKKNGEGTNFLEAIFFANITECFFLCESRHWVIKTGKHVFFSGPWDGEA